MFVHFLTPSNQDHTATERLKSAGVAGLDFFLDSRDPLIHLPEKCIFLYGKHQAKVYVSGQEGDQHKFEMIEINTSSFACFLCFCRVNHRILAATILNTCRLHYSNDYSHHTSYPSQPSKQAYSNRVLVSFIVHL